MAIKMKGIFKGLKIISQMFAHKEQEMEIGYPTDVKHVAHIGLGTSDTSPSWMAEFKGTDDSSAGSVSTAAQSRQTSWASADFEQPRSMLPIDIFQDKRPGQENPDVQRGERKARRKKTKKNRASSPPASSARSSSARSTASFATAYDAFSESQRGFPVA
ncbi:CRIB domain-containing protein RIC10 [Zea mays]|uniref:CRIB domain-containing protein RIC10 n=2 Tax=Zea mays TaxID=4577 RepID=A0A1D6H1E1_MAIZE|nr:CRIB domain-containing protein RIC10 [Zea mays]AQK68697.1 CRIB domain-containing protein RIC10 [Zea mays]|eukprot:XP_008645274.1 CRIB domain-containing protein RIC10 [Zea mays]